jgi:hypothetical protein
VNSTPWNVPTKGSPTVAGTTTPSVESLTGWFCNNVTAALSASVKAAGRTKPLAWYTGWKPNGALVVDMFGFPQREIG